MDIFYSKATKGHYSNPLEKSCFWKWGVATLDMSINLIPHKI